jgi:tRNA-dihydrouridine synthase B
MTGTWRIGDLEITGRSVLAPLAGIGDPPFRRICKRYGASLVYTEFVSAQGLLQKNKYTKAMLALNDNEHPVGIQLFGHEPGHLAQASRFVQDAGADFVDLNCGCPERKIVSTGAGAALLKDPDLIARIVEAMARSVTIPVTVKIRLGVTRESNIAAKLARMVEDAGAKAIAVNACFVSQGLVGPYYWDELANIVQSVKIPVIGNGGVKVPEDARKMMETGISAVMLGRSCLGAPWIFGQVEAAVDDKQIPPRPSLSERFNVMLEHLQAIVDYKGEKIGVSEMRKHWAWYVRGLHDSARFKEEAIHVKTLDKMREHLLEYRQRLLEKGFE